ncbi:MAG: ADP-ribosylation factor-like protein [Promethearchaeota archaeon]
MDDSLLFFKSDKPNKEKLYKILFTGLDGAGKSSIILALRREYSKIALITPTKGVQRTNFIMLGREINEWDLGGQKLYLISYLKNPSKYFDGTAIAIYVIDILDDSRLHESLSYLNDVVDKFKELKINPPINIFFHKHDPKLNITIKTIIDKRIDELQKEIEEKVNYKKIHFFSTSIYDPYTIMNAMSIILLELYPKSELVQKTIEEFAKKLNCHGLLVVDKNSIIIGSHFKDKDSNILLSKTIGYFLNLNDSFIEMGLEDQKDQIIVRKLKNYFLFKPLILDDGMNQYYVLVLKKDNPFDLYFINKDFLTFTNMLKNIIEN